MIIHIMNSPVHIDRVINASIKHIVDPNSLCKYLSCRKTRLEITYYLDNGQEGTLIYRDPLILRINGERVLIKSK